MWRLFANKFTSSGGRRRFLTCVLATPIVASISEEDQKKKNQQKKKRTFNVLSIDGGGVRGIIPAIVLQAIEKDTGKSIFELFDLIAGTSSGGLLALGLVKPSDDDPNKCAFTAEALAKSYDRDSSKIFYQGWTSWWLGKLSWSHQLTYTIFSLTMLLFVSLWPDSHILKRVLSISQTPQTQILGNMKKIFGFCSFFFSVQFIGKIYKIIQSITHPAYDALQGLHKMCNEKFGTTTLSQALTDVVITTYDTKTRTPRIIMSRDAKISDDRQWKDYLMNDVAIATASAPTYFQSYSPPVREDHNSGIRDQHLVDGAVFANNPTLIAYVKAKEIISADDNFSGDDIFVVSLGTGKPPHGGFVGDAGGIYDWLKGDQSGIPKLLGITLDHSLSHMLMEGLIPDPKRYHRLNVEFPENIDLDAISKLGELRRRGEEILMRNEKEISEVVEHLKENSRI